MKTIDLGWRVIVLVVMGAAAGAAQTGLRPIAELMFMDFLGVCFDQIYNQAAKFRYMFGGKAVTPLLLQRLYELTEGRSLTANIALVLNNARLAGAIAQDIIAHAAENPDA